MKQSLLFYALAFAASSSIGAAEVLVIDPSDFDQIFTTAPEGTAGLLFEEKLKVSGGCDSFDGDANLVLTIVQDDGTLRWTAETPSGDYSGTMTRAGSNGRKYNLAFDAPSLALYESYLETVASQLCGTPVAIDALGVRGFQVKFSKDLRQVSIDVQSSATGSTAFGAARGSHALRAKGPFSLGGP